MGIVAGASASARKWFADTRAKVSNYFTRKRAGKQLGSAAREYQGRYKKDRDVMGEKLAYEDERKRLRKSKLTPEERLRARARYHLKTKAFDPTGGVKPFNPLEG